MVVKCITEHGTSKKSQYLMYLDVNKQNYMLHKYRQSYSSSKNWRCFYSVLVAGVEKKTHVSKCAVERKATVPISLKDEFSERILQKFVALKPKVWSYLTNNGHVDKSKKVTKMCVIKRKIKFED